MKILALEAARTPCAVAAIEVDENTGGIDALELGILADGRALAEELIILTDSVLARVGWEMSEVQGLAIGIGPGSWTGLRIALSTWKTLSQTLDIPIVGVPSFDALAQAAWRSDEREINALYLVSAPCRPGVAYGKICEAHPDYLITAQDEWIDTPTTLIDALLTQALARGIDEPPLIIGALDADDESGEKTLAGAHWQSLQTALQDSRQDASIALIDIQSATVEVALAALARLGAGERDDALNLQPLYLAPSAAERKRDEPLSAL